MQITFFRNEGRKEGDEIKYIHGCIAVFPYVRNQVVESVILKERPDGVVVSMGGQTALNCGVKLHNAGVRIRCVRFCTQKLFLFACA